MPQKKMNGDAPRQPAGNDVEEAQLSSLDDKAFHIWLQIKYAKMSNDF